MKILHLSRDDNSGGASKAAYRLHCALSQYGVDSHMRVLNRETANIRVTAGRPARTFQAKVKNKLQRYLNNYLNRNWKTDNAILHSFGEESAGIVGELNQSDADVLNLHWIAEFLSIQDIGKLNKPLVWTFHDMWALCGGEHVAPDDAHSRFRMGYLPHNRPVGEAGPDLNRYTWEQKLKAWSTQRFNIVAPSHWMARCIHDSILFKDSPVHVIPNPLEMEFLWHPLPKEYARLSLGLDPKKRYVLSGSAGGMPQLKGEDLLSEAMTQLAKSDLAMDTELLIFGQYQPSNATKWPLPVNWLGPIKDDHVMATIYSAADVTVVPSRQDNLPNIAVESQACGTPVVGFHIGGIPDIVTHQQTGWIAEPFDTEKLASGIHWVLSDPSRLNSLSRQARSSAKEKFNPERIAQQYAKLYEDILCQSY